jgi:hypothetical protein
MYKKNDTIAIMSQSMQSEDISRTLCNSSHPAFYQHYPHFRYCFFDLHIVSKESNVPLAFCICIISICLKIKWYFSIDKKIK